MSSPRLSISSRLLVVNSRDVGVTTAMDKTAVARAYHVHDHDPDPTPGDEAVEARTIYHE